MSSPFKKLSSSPLGYKRKFSDSLIFQKESNSYQKILYNSLFSFSPISKNKNSNFIKSPKILK